MTPGRPSVAVLFVHGIGTQRRGETLHQASEAIFRWLHQWPSLDCEWVKAPQAAVVGLEDAKEVASRPLLVKHKDGTDEWLLAESWWDEEVPPPRPSQVLRWAFRVIPWVVLWNLFDWSGGVEQNHKASTSRQTLRQVLGFMLEVSVGLILRAAAFVVLVASCLLLAVLTLVPGVRTSVNVILSRHVGDSFALVTEPKKFDAMVSKVAEDLREIQRHCQRTVVVAHSQGAMITARALERPGVKRLSGFLAYGSGAGPLSTLISADRSRLVSAWITQFGLVVYLWAALPFSLGVLRGAADLALLAWGLVGSTAQWLMLLPGKLASEAYWAIPPSGQEPITEVLLSQTSDLFSDVSGLLSDWRIYMGIALIVAGNFVRNLKSSQSGQTSLFDRSRRPRRWMEVVSSADPIPTPETYAPGCDRLIRVQNFASVLRDHSTYWKNRDQFIPVVLAVIAERSGRSSLFSVGDQHFLEKGFGRRSRRVSWLRRLRLVTSFGLFITLVAQPNFSAWLGLGAHTLIAVTPVNLAVGMLVVGLSLRLAWASWNEAAMRRVEQRLNDGYANRLLALATGAEVPGGPARSLRWASFTMAWLGLGGSFQFGVVVLWAYENGRLPLPQFQFLFVGWTAFALAWLALGDALGVRQRTHVGYFLAMLAPTLALGVTSSADSAMVLWQPFGLVPVAAGLATIGLASLFELAARRQARRL